MEFTKIREMLKNLIDDSTSTEKVEAIGKISGELDRAEQEQKDLIQKQEDLRKKYIKAITETSFKDVPDDENKVQPKSLEECIQEQIEKRKD